MTFSRPRRPMLAWAAACALGTACGSPSAPHGAPILTQVYWVADGAQLLAWSREPDQALVSPVPPFASEVDFVFDRRLDGSRLEDIVTVGGVPMARPKPTPAIRASWPDMAAMMSDPPFALVVDYNSVARFGGVSSYVFARPAVAGFPSSATVTFDLDTALLTSVYGDAAEIDGTVLVKTKAFAVSIATGGAPVAPSHQVALAFSNRLPAVPASSPLIHVTAANGAVVPYKLLADANRASRWYVVAADCLGGWPASTTFTVTIDAGLPDAFGGKLAEAVAATFTTAAGTSAPDASCSIPDAGPPDSGAADAGADLNDASADAAGASGGVGDAGDDAAAADGSSPD